MTDLKALDAEATPGVWCQFHPIYCPEAKGSRASEWDTSHDVSALTDRGRYRVGQFRHARDAAFAEALVNAYRAGRLVEVSHTPEARDSKPENSE